MNRIPGLCLPGIFSGLYNINIPLDPGKFSGRNRYGQTGELYAYNQHKQKKKDRSQKITGIIFHVLTF